MKKIALVIALALASGALALKPPTAFAKGKKHAAKKGQGPHKGQKMAKKSASTASSAPASTTPPPAAVEPTTPPPPASGK